ncbi:MAG: threonine--tRNA ligase [Candidatus Pacebacteria bacterium]|nr:threonine--tRNA ligase [Candidatus Paceibacterota bacterium]
MNNIENIRHSLAHLLAASVLKKYKTAKLGIGPSIENGFYYDIQFKNPIAEADLAEFEKEIKNLIAQKLEFKGEKITPLKAKKLFAGQKFKLDLIKEFSKDKKDLTIYKTGEVFTDLCKGGHVKNTSEINPEAFKLTHTAGAYWRGDEKNPQLTRIYGLAFESKEELENYIKQQEEAKKRDHKILGPQLDLFFIDEKIGKGLPLWTPKGTAVKFELASFARELERKYGYEHVETPYLGAEELYRTSGHLDHYSSNMYAPINMDGGKFYLRPMACPHHIRMYQRKQWSYKELPIRYAEIADYNRYEKSGELMGMIRVRKFQLTDGHIFIAPEGLKEEFKNVCNMISEGIKGLGLLDIVSYRFSKRDPKNKEKYFKDDKLWNHAESIMKEALDELGLKYIEAEDEAAFYGPKLDVQAKNINGKEDTLFTAQIDFLLPQKFEIEYIDQDGQKKRPVMIHRSTIGCLERTFGFLIEHYAGAFPLWLSPVQARILPISEKFSSYANELKSELLKNNIRADFPEPNETLGKRIRAGEMEKIPLLIIMGEKEVTAKTLTMRRHSDKSQKEMTISELISLIQKEVKEKK